MSQPDDQASKGAVRFDAREEGALREIVTDWANGRLVAPPYPPEITSIIEKLGIREQIGVPDILPPPNFQDV